MSHLHNCNSETNGELRLMKSLPPNLTIFDVGCRDDSLFQQYQGTVHYFDPVSDVVDKLQLKPTRNTQAFYNKFGLSDKEETILYYPKWGSFLSRIPSCGYDDAEHAYPLKVKRADNYIEQFGDKFDRIGLLKIDTEGYEYDVLKGFGEKLKIVDRVQFEYGGTYLDRKVSMKGVIDVLKSSGFSSFFYVHPDGLLSLTDYADHYTYCNIYCERTN